MTYWCLLHKIIILHLSTPHFWFLLFAGKNILAFKKNFCYLFVAMAKPVSAKGSWVESDVKLTGKTVIITGANTGIGLETAIDLAKREAKVIMACRNLEKAQQARSRVSFPELVEVVSTFFIFMYLIITLVEFESDVVNLIGS